MVTFGALPKVTRRKGGTLSSRYRSNGYVPHQWLKDRLAPKHAQNPRRHSRKPKVAPGATLAPMGNAGASIEPWAEDNGAPDSDKQKGPDLKLSPCSPTPLYGMGLKR